MSGYWSKLWYLKGGGPWVTLSTNFRGKGESSTNDSWRQKTRVLGLSRGTVCVILRLAVLIQYWHVTDTDTRRRLILMHHWHHAGKKWKQYTCGLWHNHD